MKSLKEKVALITGSGQGIGRELALALAREGCHIVVNDRDQDKAVETVEEVRKQRVRAHSIIADVSQQSQAEAMCREAVKKMGRVDILVNNAALSKTGRIEDLTLPEWKEILEVNLWAHIYTTRALLPHMIQRGSGHFVHIASGGGLFSAGFLLPYGVSKFGVVGYAEALAAQVRSQGIDVTIICPGWTRTRVFDSYLVAGSEYTRETLHKWAARMKPLCMKPERMAKKIVKAIRRRRFFVVTHWDVKVGVFLRMLFPRLALWLNATFTDRILPPADRKRP